MHHQRVLLEQGRQRGAIDLRRVDQPDLLTIMDLNQGQLWPEGALAHEFRVQVQGRCRRQSGLPGGDVVAVVAPEVSHEVA